MSEAEVELPERIRRWSSPWNPKGHSRVPGRPRAAPRKRLTSQRRKLSKDKDNSDSSTSVNRVWRGRRRVVGFRCNEKLWMALKQLAEAQGSSICHFLEAVIAGVLAAEHTPVNKRSTIEIKELHVTRAVKRVRRYAREPVVAEGEPMVDKWVDRGVGFWDRVPVSEGVNPQGHAIGCLCKICGGR